MTMITKDWEEMPIYKPTIIEHVNLSFPILYTGYLYLRITGIIRRKILSKFIPIKHKHEDWLLLPNYNKQNN